MRAKTLDESIDMKELSVRKLVRVIYEHFGKAQERQTAQKLSRSYPKGIVRFEDVRVGEWRDGEFILQGLGLTLKRPCAQQKLRQHQDKDIESQEGKYPDKDNHNHEGEYQEEDIHEYPEEDNTHQ
eukprot:8352482-Karenia_brevis.AAC.1